MAVDLWPYSQRSSGRVTDAEHETLWAWVEDGILPGQAASAGAVTINATTRAWSVAAADINVAGHVLRVDAAATGTLAAGGTANRVDLICAYVNHSTSPWTYGIGVHAGVVGGGTPSPTQSRSGLWEVPLAAATVVPAGTASIVDYHPVIIPPAIRANATAAVASPEIGQRLQIPSGRYYYWTGTAWVSPIAQSYGPGAASALNVGTTEQVVNTLSIPSAPWDRMLAISAGCYINATQVNDIFDVLLYHDGVVFGGGGQARNSTEQSITAVALSATPLAVPAGSAVVLQMRVRRFGSGTGLAGTSADANHNHIDVLAVPA